LPHEEGNGAVKLDGEGFEGSALPDEDSSREPAVRLRELRIR
jgi:hypothetical protein